VSSGASPACEAPCLGGSGKPSLFVIDAPSHLSRRTGFNEHMETEIIGQPDISNSDYREFCNFSSGQGPGRGFLLGRTYDSSRGKRAMARWESSSIMDTSIDGRGRRQAVLWELAASSLRFRVCLRTKTKGPTRPRRAASSRPRSMMRRATRTAVEASMEATAITCPSHNPTRRKARRLELHGSLLVSVGGRRRQAACRTNHGWRLCPRRGQTAGRRLIWHDIFREVTSLVLSIHEGTRQA
jgi:hypothetical protein